MIIRHLSVHNFRGIKSLDWKIDSPLVCLIGPCDSTKSTILTAIEYALYPLWSLTLNDTDFYDQKFENPIDITVTIGDIPDKLMEESKFGFNLRGWNKTKGLVDEPDGDDEPVLSIKLTVDKTLEPKWVVFTDRNPEGIIISAKDREILSVSLLGVYTDRDLSWSKGSSLLRLTGQLENSDEIISEARRTFRAGIANSNGNSWEEVCKGVEKVAKQYGVAPKNSLKPGFDLKGNIHAAGYLALHDGPVPARLYGLGSRRILGLSIQQQITPHGAILLIDEIENALEPFRLRHLIRELRNSIKIKTADKDKGISKTGQVIMTTHSDVTIVECSSDELFIVHNKNGEISVNKADKNLQNVIRSSPEALLSPKIIIGEGKTELGLSRGLDAYWQNEGKLPFAYLGITPISGGGGDGAAMTALAFHQLGYETILVLDSDREVKNIEKAREAHIPVVRWEDGYSIEERIFNDIAWETVNSLLAMVLADENTNKMNELDAIGQNLLPKISGNKLSENLDEWMKQGYKQEKIRLALGKTAKSRKWFKRIDLGEKLGSFLGVAIELVSSSTLYKKIDELKRWCYG